MKIIIFLIGLILFSGCAEAVFDDREYSKDEVPPAQIKIDKSNTEGWTYVGDFCDSVFYDGTTDGCLMKAKYKTKCGICRS